MNNNVEEESRWALNYSDLKYISENRMFNDSIVNAQKQIGYKKQISKFVGVFYLFKFSKMEWCIG